MWRGMSIASGANPPTSSARQILYKLFEVNFRYELLFLDRACYELQPEGFDQQALSSEDSPKEGEVSQPNYDNLDASLFGDRQVQILAAIPHFNSSLIPGDNNDGQNGFVSHDAERRREAYVGLYRVMRTWCRVPSLCPQTVMAAERLVSGSTDDLALATAESGLAYHYTLCYFTVIGRPPLLPHGL